MSAPPSERKLQAQLAAYESWANCDDRTARTAPARAAFDARFADAADPEAARKAYFTRLALKSAQARRKAQA